MKLRSRVTKIAEEVFQHGKLTPDKSYDLPKGQKTIADAIDQLLELFKGYGKEIIGEDENLPFKMVLEKNSRDFTLIAIIAMTKNKLRSEQRKKLKEIWT